MALITGAFPQSAAVSSLSSPTHMAVFSWSKFISPPEVKVETPGVKGKFLVLVFINHIYWIVTQLFFFGSFYFRKHVHGRLLWWLSVYPSVQTLLWVNGRVQVPLVSQRLLPVHRARVRGLRQQGCQVHELPFLRCRAQTGTKYLCCTRGLRAEETMTVTC